MNLKKKPKNPKNNLASMGVYVFSWPVLRSYLTGDAISDISSHDFGKDIIPQMLAGNERLCAYRFAGYWKDVGTVESFWEANMDLLSDEPALDLYDPISMNLFGESNPAPHVIANTASGLFDG